MTDTPKITEAAEASLGKILTHTSVPLHMAGGYVQAMTAFEMELADALRALLDAEEFTKPQSAPPTEEWWLLTGGFSFAAAARRFAGPFSSREDAFMARSALERELARKDLFIDAVSPESAR